MDRTAAPASARDDVVLDIAAGAVAGAIGVWAMDQIGWFMLRTENTQALARDLQARPGRETTGVMGADTTAQVRSVQRSPVIGAGAAGAAKKATQVSGVSSPHQRPGPAATALHYTLGMLSGAFYGAARRVRPSLSAGHGALYGLGLFVVMDEAAAPLVGIASAPGRYPWRAHARGLTAHLILGITTEALLHATDAFRQTRRR